MGEVELVRVALGELLGVEGHGVHARDDGVGEQAVGDGLGFGIGDPDQVVPVPGGDLGAGADQCFDRVGNGLCGRVHDARERVDLNEGAAGRAGTDFGAFHNGVTEQLRGNQVELSVREGRFDEVDACGMGTLELIPELVCTAEQGLGARVSRVLSGVYLDAMDELLVVVAAGWGRVGGCGGGAHKWIVDPARV